MSAAPVASRPPTVRVLSWLLAVTAAATIVVELLIWWYAESGDFGLAVRTTWAVLRSLGFLLLIRQVRLGRASARPFGLILVVTTLFAVARLVVPKQGLPAAPGVLGFAALLALCAAVLLLLYRSEQIDAYLRRHRRQVVFDRNGISLQEVAPKRPPVAGWVLTARVAVLAYGPLMFVPAVVAIGVVLEGRVTAAPLVAAWFAAAFLTSYVMALTSFFLIRGKRWARAALVVMTVGVVVVQVVFCWLLLRVDGLVRDGGPLVVTAGLALLGLWRSAGRPVDEQ
ncbi:MAG: hypothetical protein HOV79_03770 [Hamadaea sp.]|nr:hypothetical protein [Hamadaea sp.]